MYLNTENLFFKCKNKIIGRYLLIAPGPDTPASGPA